MAIERLAVVAIIAAALAGCSHSYSGASTGNPPPPKSVTTNEGAPAGPGAPSSYQPSHVTGTTTPGESDVSGTGSSTSGGSGSGTSGAPGSK